MKLISLIVLLISLVFFYTAPNYPSRPFMGFCTIIAIFLIVLQIKGYCTDKELKKIYLRHSTIFLIFFFRHNRSGFDFCIRFDMGLRSFCCQ